MEDMQFARKSTDIIDILQNTDLARLENLVRNVVAYASSNNKTTTNWIAHELFVDVIDNEMIIEIFDEE